MKITINALLAVIAVIIVCLFGVSFVFYTKNKNLSNEVNELKQKQEILAQMLLTRNTVQQQSQPQQTVSTSKTVCDTEKCTNEAEPVIIENEATRDLSKDEFMTAADTIQEVDINSLLGEPLQTIPEEEIVFDITKKIENSIDEDIIQEEVIDMLHQENKEDEAFELEDEVRDLSNEEEDSDNEVSSFIDDEESESLIDGDEVIEVDDSDDEPEEDSDEESDEEPEEESDEEQEDNSEPSNLDLDLDIEDNLNVEDVISFSESIEADSSIAEIEISTSEDEENPDEVEEAQCEYVYKRGKSKGKRCGNPVFVDGCCKTHAEKK